MIKQLQTQRVAQEVGQTTKFAKSLLTFFKKCLKIVIPSLFLEHTMKKIIPLAIVMSLLAACASTGKIAPAYVNPNNYQTQSCENLSEEVRRVTTLAKQTEQEQTSLSSTGLGIGIVGGSGGIYPSISFGVGTGNQNNNSKKARLSKIYGEHDAMIVAARKKGCEFANHIKIYGE